jgi:periplasmic protein TonB
VLRQYRWPLLISFGVHVLFFVGLGHAAMTKTRQRDAIIEFELATQAPPTAAKPEPPAPKAVDARQEKIKPPATPPPNSPGDNAPEKVKPVFGISMTSVVGPGVAGGITVRVGNTIMKEPEKEFTPASEVKSYRPVPIHQLSRLPEKKGECMAEYPQQAKQLRIEGQVKLEVEILASGEVHDVRVIRGLGHGLDEAAVAALRRCRFAPGLAGDQPAATTIEYTYTFVLED